MSDAVRRLERWNAKFSPELARQTNERIYDSMSRRYAAAVTALVAMEEKAKQTLDASGVPPCLYVPYLDYARQLFRLYQGRRISGDSLAREAQVLLEKWQARTLNPDVLARIRTEVFSVSAPTP
jgi:hypothetical protein